MKTQKTWFYYWVIYHNIYCVMLEPYFLISSFFKRYLPLKVQNSSWTHENLDLPKVTYVHNLVSFRFRARGHFFFFVELDLPISLGDLSRCESKFSWTRLSANAVLRADVFFTPCFRSLPILRYCIPLADLAIFERKTRAWIFLDLHFVANFSGSHNWYIFIGSCTQSPGAGRKEKKFISLFFIERLTCECFCHRTVYILN